MNWTPSNRLDAIPPYIFSQINAFKAEALKRGMKLTSLAIGDPDKPTPQILVEKMKEAIARPGNHAYSSYDGSLEFRTAVATYMQKRFNVGGLRPDREICALIGSKEGIAHFPLAVCDAGDVALYPSPGYPVFQTALILAGAKPMPYSLKAERGFLPDVNELKALMEKHRPKYIIVNFPSNPTSVMAPKELVAKVVDLCKTYKVTMAYDNAYSEIYLKPEAKPFSVLEIPGAKDVAVEFHSLSKTFNMTGWRLGWAVGNESLVQNLLKAKTHIDSGPLLSVQEVGSFALSKSDEISEPIRQVYVSRGKVLRSGLSRLGIEVCPSETTFFVWAKIPIKQKSLEFTKGLIDTEGLVVTPGIGFGEEGEGFFRLAMTVDEPEIEASLKRLERYLNR